EIHPNATVDHDHRLGLVPSPFTQISFPTDLSRESKHVLPSFAKNELREGLMNQLLLCPAAQPPHAFLHQSLVQINICSHRPSNLYTNCRPFMCMRQRLGFYALYV